MCIFTGYAICLFGRNEQREIQTTHLVEMEATEIISGIMMKDNVVHTQFSTDLRSK